MPSGRPGEARGLVKRYGAITAVDQVDLTVEPGDVYGFLGPNGAGKTTTLRMLLGLIRPDAGQIRLFGRDPQHELPEALDGVAGFVETPRFYPYLSGRKNLELLAAFDGGEASSRIDEALGIVELSADDRELRFTAPEQAAVELSLALAGGGIGIAALVPENVSLEDFFFRLTEHGSGAT